MICQHIQDDRGSLAVFDDEAKAKLPPEGMLAVPFDAVIYDVKTGKSYNVKQDYAAYEENEWPNVYAPGRAWSLQHYFYAEHWCGCHRWSSIGSDADIEDDNDCPSGRFFVTSLTHPNLPGVVLFSESIPSAAR
jgi:hypothetical protein